MKRRTQSGMTRIELRVALAIGAFLMLGAMTVFMQSRTTFRVTESLSRLQENGRLAISILEPDIRMAHYWGLTNLTGNITNRARPNATNGIGSTTNIQYAVDANASAVARTTWRSSCTVGRSAQWTSSSTSNVGLDAAIPVSRDAIASKSR